MEIPEQTILVLQGGGALGAYQAGAYAALAEAGHEPGWVAGISIGAVNAALICGNPPARREAALRHFWEGITASLPAPPFALGPTVRKLYGEVAAASVTMTGVPGFFRPNLPFAFAPVLPHPALGVYDTAPLRDTLLDLVDFDYLNDAGPRLSVGAVDIETANFAYFDSRERTIGPEHVMASGALPPGFPPVAIDGRLYWDGGLVSNTPLQYVMDNLGAEPVVIFQVDLFAARGMAPDAMTDVGQRQKDIQYSSRTRLTTDRYAELHALRRAASRLAARLPKEMQDDPDLKRLTAAGPEAPIKLVELIHRKQGFEGGAKDYDFSRDSMTRHWAEGAADVARTLAHPKWLARKTGQDGLQILDPGAAGTGRQEKRT
ncbi:DUF3734 domain-containing protein [Oceaniglobus roseus]|uniref:DUF3734 domain-containing protein n=1 Tax=Oceaniglobus roseus TaxID=1737570 RepID=UPI000C7F0BA0|nr:DUF3734 domain-containing protein [Kandeliimicrobium roseum]